MLLVTHFLAYVSLEEVLFRLIAEGELENVVAHPSLFLGDIGDTDIVAGIRYDIFAFVRDAHRNGEHELAHPCV